MSRPIRLSTRAGALRGRTPGSPAGPAQRRCSLSHFPPARSGAGAGSAATAPVVATAGHFTLRFTRGGWLGFRRPDTLLPLVGHGPRCNHRTRSQTGDPQCRRHSPTILTYLAALAAYSRALAPVSNTINTRTNDSLSADDNRGVAGTEPVPGQSIR